ncbi:hypothetical protein BDZ91DRAFT_42818 [Kalaharituber pfeilii]|nr:hypothetical protein BDZ91DRAFT_42818 [Kalaharituber pfeilii]
MYDMRIDVLLQVGLLSLFLQTGEYSRSCFIWPFGYKILCNYYCINFFLSSNFFFLASFFAFSAIQINTILEKGYLSSHRPAVVADHLHCTRVLCPPR